MVSEPQFYSNFEKNYKDKLPDEIQLNWDQKFALDFPDENFLEFHEDRVAVASMLTLLPTIIYHNNWIKGAIINIDNIIQMIENELS